MLYLFYAILPPMKQYDYITPQVINRLAFKAYFNHLKSGASGMKLLGKKSFFMEAARYLINIEKTKHGIERSAIKSGLGHVERKLARENTSIAFREGVADAKSELIEILDYTCQPT